MGYATYEWFLNKDLSKYSGDWIVVIDEKVVANGKNAGQLIRETKVRYPGKRPFITKVKDRLEIL